MGYKGHGERAIMARTAVKSLGEIALRVEELDKMVAFYKDVIRLELLRRAEEHAFFKIAEGYRGHTQVLALFDRTAVANYKPISAAHTTVDHIAFTIDLGDFESERARLEELEHKVWTAEHGWVQWRSLYLKDPEGNTVEFVCFDASIVSYPA